MVQITASKCKCSAYGWYLLYGVGTKCHGTSAQNKPILLTDNHQLSGTAGIYLSVFSCFVLFCLPPWNADKKHIDQKRVKCQGQMKNAIMKQTVS